MTESSSSPLISIFSAARDGNVEEVAESLRRGSDVNARGKEGRTPLMLATAGAHVPVIELLLKIGTQPNLQDNKGRTALILSSLKGDREVSALLLEAGASPNLRDKNGRSPLRCAITSKSHDVVRLLLHYGADPDETDDEGFTLTRHLMRNKQITIANLLVEYGGQGKQEAQLIESVEAGSIDDVRSLLDRGVDPNTRQINGETALMLAAERGFVGVAKALLKMGADIDARDKNGYTALMHSRPLFHWFSPDSWAQIKASTDERQSARYFDRRAEEQTEIVRLLVSKGAEVDARDSRGETTLIQAACGYGPYDVPIVRELLAHKANVHLKGPDGNALSSAVEGGEKGIVEALLAKGADPNSTIPYESEHMSVLIWATICGRGDIVDLLLSHGADPNHRCGKITALHVAAYTGNTQIFKELITNRADLLRNGPGALALAKVGSAIAQQLIDYGIERDSKLTDGPLPTTVDIATLASRVRLRASRALDQYAAEGVRAKLVPGGLPWSGKRK